MTRLPGRIDPGVRNDHLGTHTTQLSMGNAMTRAIRLIVSAIFLAPVAALAGPQYTAEDIVKFFAKNKRQTPAKLVTPVGKGAGLSGRSRILTRDGKLVIPRTGDIDMASGGHKPTKGFDLLITFEFGSDRLTPQARTNLSAFASALRSPALARYRFEVHGHTDAVGPAEKNQRLSERRARSVVTYLVSRGVSPGRLRARGYGESRPLMKNPKHPRNRRVETRRMR